MPTPITRRTVLAATASGAAAWAVGSPAFAEKKPTMPIIDPHVHVWKNDPKYPWPKELKEPPAEDALPEDLLKVMRANGVAQTVIVHVIYYRWDCRYAADVVKAHPQQFEGVCRVDPMADSAADDLTKWVEEGYHGVRLRPYDGPVGDWINDRKRMDRIWTRAAELKIPMCVYCPITRIPEVERVIRRHPNLDVCIDHMAECPFDDAAALANLLKLARYPRVFVKLSHLWRLSKQPYPYLDTHEMVKKLYDAFGPQRLMWGSDWPAVDEFCGYTKALQLYRDEIKFFNDDDRKWILGGTAKRLWPFK